MSVPGHIIVSGLIIGLTYGLLAVGLVLIYKSSRVLNFAHGQLGAISAILLEKLVNDWGAPYWVSLPLALATGVVTGAASELLLRRLFNRPRFVVMVATIGISQLLFVLSLLWFLQPEAGAAPYPTPFAVTATLDTFILQPGHVAILVLAPLVAVGLALFFRLTPYGLAIRAAAENAESARLGGIWVRRVSTLSWMLAGLLSAATAILTSPFQPNVYAEAVGPSLLVKGLIAALLGAMIDLRVAFVAGIGLGVVEAVVFWNADPAAVEAAMFAMLVLALIVRGRSLRTTSRTEERSSWQLGAATRLAVADVDRVVVGRIGTVVAFAVLALLPLFLSNSKAFLFTRIFVFAIVGLSLTLLAGWAGQLSLGHFGLLAVGAIMTARFGEDLPLPVLLLATGLVAALVAVVVGLPALRIRGLYLAVLTLGFAVLVQGWVLPHPRFGLPDAASQLVLRPDLLDSQQAMYWFCLALTVLAVAAVHRLRHSGVGRSMIAVRDNEGAAAAMGIAVVRVKLTAFAVSGFLAGIAGVAFAYNQERFSATASGIGGGSDFDPARSIFIVALIVIGGVGSIRGALLGSFYLLGLPAIFGYSQVVELLTGGIGLTLFILYLPGGLAGALDRLGDVVAKLIEPRGPVAADAPAPAGALT